MTSQGMSNTKLAGSIFLGLLVCLLAETIQALHKVWCWAFRWESLPTTILLLITFPVSIPLMILLLRMKEK